MDRRRFLTQGGAAAAALAIPAIPFEADAEIVISQAVINSVHASLTPIIQRMSIGLLQRNDLLTAAAQTNALIAEFSAKNFDAAFKSCLIANQANANLSPLSSNFTLSSMAQRIYEVTSKVAPRLTYPQICTALGKCQQFNPALPSNVRTNLVADALGSLRQNGCTPYLRMAAANFDSIVPIDPPQSQNNCPLLNETLWFLGAVFTALGIICLFFPAALPGCVVLGIIGLMIGLIAAIVGLIFCPSLP